MGGKGQTILVAINPQGENQTHQVADLWTSVLLIRLNPSHLIYLFLANKIPAGYQ